LLFQPELGSSVILHYCYCNEQNMYSETAGLRLRQQSLGVFLTEPDRYSDHATGWTNRGSKPVRHKRLSLSTKVQTGTQPPIQWVLLFFPAVNRLKRGADNSHPPKTKVKNEWRYISTLPIRFHDPDMNNFTFRF